MNEDKLPETVRMLVDRMQTHPNEFVNEYWDPVAFNPWEREPFEDVRWSNVIRGMMTTGKEILFDDEEINFFKFHYKQLLRSRISECVVKELVGGEREKEIEFKEKQMELPYTTTFSNNIANLSRAQREEQLKWLRESYEAYEANKNKGMLG